MEICMITPDDKVSPFLRITGQAGSEITGPAFTPAGNRLYFSSQRGTSGLVVRRHHLLRHRPVPAIRDDVVAPYRADFARYIAVSAAASSSAAP